MTRTLCLSWIVLLLASAASAQNPTLAHPPADDLPPEHHLQRAHALVKNLEYESAVLEYSLVITDPDADEELKQQARLHAAVANRIMRNDVDARVLLLAYFQRSPDGQLPAGQHPPKVVSFFELVREEARRRPARDVTAPPPKAAPPEVAAPVVVERTQWDPGFLAVSGLMALGGVGVIGSGIAAELLIYQTGALGGANNRLDVGDFVGPGLMASGAVVAISSLAFTPFWRSSVLVDEGEGQ